MMRSPFEPRRMLAGVALVACLLLIPSPSFASTESDLARDQAKRILQDKKYGRDDKTPLSKDAQRLSRWLGEGDKRGKLKERSDKQIEEQSQPRDKPKFTPPALGGLGTFGQLIFWIIIAALIGGIGFLIYKAIANSKSTPKKAKDSEIEDDIDIDWSDEEKVLETITDFDLLERLSDEAEKAGKFDLALRYRFRAGLLRLNEMRIISFHPSVTNAQWQLLIDNESFNLITRDFNDVTYGERPCDQSHLQRARQGWSTLTTKDRKSVG